MTPTKYSAVVILTALAAGRAMTLAYIGRAGDGGAGDPPAEWLMPLLGDAAIGLTAVLVVALMVVRSTPTVWLVAVVWNAVAAFDALAAYVVDTTAPWPEFFMLEILGRSMFFAAAGMHAVLIWLLSTGDVRNRFGLERAATRRSADLT